MLTLQHWSVRSTRRAGPNPYRSLHGRTHRRPDETAALVLADLEHELRILGHSVWVCAAECEREPDLRDARRQGREHPDPLDRGTGDWADRAADCRLLLRSHLEPAGASASVFPDGCHPRVAGARGDAQLAVALGRGWDAVGDGRVDQYLDGAVPRVRR